MMEQYQGTFWRRLSAGPWLSADNTEEQLGVDDDLGEHHCPALDYAKVTKSYVRIMEDCKSLRSVMCEYRA